MLCSSACIRQWWCAKALKMNRRHCLMPEQGILNWSMLMWHVPFSPHFLLWTIIYGLLVKSNEAFLGIVFSIDMNGTPLPLAHIMPGLLVEYWYEIDVRCFYRKHDVSSEPLKPTWIPYAATEVAEENLLFSLKLMTGGCWLWTVSFPVWDELGTLEMLGR